MQLFELCALALYLLSYAGSGLLAIVRPAAYRASEIRFYTTGKPEWEELFVFVTGTAACAALAVHVITETPRLGQLLLYAQCAMFLILLPLHFRPFLRGRMKSTLERKSEADYRSSGMRKLAVAVLMLLLPLLVRP